MAVAQKNRNRIASRRAVRANVKRNSRDDYIEMTIAIHIGNSEPGAGFASSVELDTGEFADGPVTISVEEINRACVG
jgi:hypothetical protein